MGCGPPLLSDRILREGDDQHFLAAGIEERGNFAQPVSKTGAAGDEIRMLLQPGKQVLAMVGLELR